MSLYHRIRRWLGYNTEKKYTKTIPLYEYTVTHLNGEESTVYAHYYRVNGAFLNFYRYSWKGEIRMIGDRPILLNDTIWPKSDKKRVRVLDGVQELEREVHNHDRFEATIDMADQSVVRHQKVAGVDNG